jgi:hypothetical protein
MATTELQAIVQFRFHNGDVEEFKRLSGAAPTAPGVPERASQNVRRAAPGRVAMCRTGKVANLKGPKYPIVVGVAPRRRPVGGPPKGGTDWRGPCT